VADIWFSEEKQNPKLGGVGPLVLKHRRKWKSIAGARKIKLKYGWRPFETLTTIQQPPQATCM
jgi:hypothetical protein